jgi:hypothetical protein
MTASRRCQHPYLRLTRIIRTVLCTRWDAATITERARVARAGWFN